MNQIIDNEPESIITCCKDHIPNEKTATILLSNQIERDYKVFSNLDDLFEELEK